MWLGSWGREWSRVWVWHGETWRHGLGHRIKRAGVRGTHLAGQGVALGREGRRWGEFQGNSHRSSLRDC